MEKGSLLIDSLQGTVTDVRGRVDLALNSITKTVNHTDGLITDARPGVNSIIENGTRIAGGVNTLVAGLNEGKGSAGLLLKDEPTREQLKSTLKNFQDASTNLDQASTRVNETVADSQSRHLIENAQVTREQRPVALPPVECGCHQRAGAGRNGRRWRREHSPDIV
jgi:hypothetical protein